MSAVVIKGRFPEAAPPSEVRARQPSSFAQRLSNFFRLPSADLYRGQHAAAALQIEYLHPHRKTWWGGF